MSKHNWKVCDWIIFYNDGEHGKPIAACAVGSQQAMKAPGTVIRGVRGTYPEVKQLVEDLNTKSGQKLLRHYVRKEKQK